MTKDNEQPMEQREKTGTRSRSAETRQRKTEGQQTKEEYLLSQLDTPVILKDGRCGTMILIILNSMAVRCETHGLLIQGTMRREKRKILNYMTAKIMCLARQSRWYGHGGKNPYFEYAEIELRHIINAVADLRGRTRVGLIIARQHRKWFEDEEKQEQKAYVCGISEKQAFRIAEEMYNNDIQFMTALEIEKMNAEQPEEDEEEDEDISAF